MLPCMNAVTLRFDIKLCNQPSVPLHSSGTLAGFQHTLAVLPEQVESLADQEHQQPGFGVFLMTEQMAWTFLLDYLCSLTLFQQGSKRSRTSQDTGDITAGISVFGSCFARPHQVVVISRVCFMIGESSVYAALHI